MRTNTILIVAVFASISMADTVSNKYPLILGATQMVLAVTDAAITNECIKFNGKNGFLVREVDPFIYIPFGRQPTFSDLIIGNIVSSSVSYFAAYIIRRTPLKKVWWVPQVSFSLGHIYAIKNNMQILNIVSQ
jgi:hypothetical protein